VNVVQAMHDGSWYTRFKPLICASRVEYQESCRQFASFRLEWPRRVVLHRLVRLAISDASVRRVRPRCSRPKSRRRRRRGSCSSRRVGHSKMRCVVPIVRRRIALTAKRVPWQLQTFSRDTRPRVILPSRRCCPTPSGLRAERLRVSISTAVWIVHVQRSGDARAGKRLEFSRIPGRIEIRPGISV